MQIACKNYDLTLIVRGYRENKPQINADKRRFVNLNIRLSEVYQRNSLIKSPQSTQRSQSLAIPATAYEPAPPSRQGTRMTPIGRIFTDRRASVSSVASVLYRILSAFIMPKPCGFSTPRTRMPAGIRGHALQRRDSGRHHPRLIFSRKTQEALAR